MKKRFTYIFSVNIFLTLISLVLFFIVDKSWTQVSIALIALLWLYGLTLFYHKTKLESLKDKVFNDLFNAIGICAILYACLVNSRFLVIQIITFIFLILMLVFSIYELVFLYKKET